MVPMVKPLEYTMIYEGQAEGRNLTKKMKKEEPKRHEEKPFKEKFKAAHQNHLENIRKYCRLSASPEFQI